MTLVTSGMTMMTSNLRRSIIIATRHYQKRPSVSGPMRSGLIQT